VAVGHGDTATVKALLNSGADPNLNFGVLEISPLDSASQDGRLEIVQLLLAHNARPRGLDVQWAAENKHYDVAVAILHYVGQKYGSSEARSWQQHQCPKCKL
jgi:ankyrin repeat protein